MQIINKCWWCGKDESVLEDSSCKNGFEHLYMPYYRYEDEESCLHPHCLNHAKTFCEVCLRKSGKGIAFVDAFIL
jgi:hypothetical protein